MELLLLALAPLAGAGGYWLGRRRGVRGERAKEEARLLHLRNRLLDGGRLTDARPDNGPPSRSAPIRLVGKRPRPGDKPPTRM